MRRQRDSACSRRVSQAYCHCILRHCVAGSVSRSFRLRSQSRHSETVQNQPFRSAISRSRSSTARSTLPAVEYPFPRCVVRIQTPPSLSSRSRRARFRLLTNVLALSAWDDENHHWTSGRRGSRYGISGFLFIMFRSSNVRFLT